ncbi:SfnB family sulfur acquisition oxidoreductase [Pantoea sp. Bo_2]|uniref:SfnB family sulfur acquisition oxidoreductase n=1 Tax=Candidatus Pantoea gossypiicola TaxID=2608008 RepID=A0AB34CFZ1_9GAMM|nr:MULTISPECIES: SfnB family sulfur acquisition oxidoreductase [Pantoea]KAA5927390.1 SfnB family sulfur acquisition oxidoreductase [Pantoea sp. VH_8]KAA5931729.1 SfnB family sulfur acquisition oxidoreductase [Pantoea sp. VH_4]KAA5940161.1 SfnB family sulfur acquisition oxidoreductase [Pantoea sp. VH_3]KAA5948885.1 SfnB family sulfur acquisition oxidoreductase [Pantoea sp. VH_25]KAA5952974.1 SfnB family sulfur acquisition oxidoreductase [Pantoea sp. VH_24]
MKLISDPPETCLAAVITRRDQAIQAAHSLAEQAKPGAIERDQQRLYPRDLLDKFTRLGLGSISIPRRYGGGGLDFQTIAEVFRIISASDPSLGQIPQNHFGLIQFILGEGNPQQQSTLLQAVVSGKRLGNGGPEKNTRHTRDIQARLVSDGLEHHLTGEKFYSTGALFADILVTTALQEGDQPAMAFIPLPADGVEIIDDWSGMGQRTTASGTVRLDRVAVDPALLIPLPPAEKPTLRGAVSQLIQAAIDAGIAQGALDDALEFVRSSSRPWVDAGVERNADDPYILADIGRISTELSAANALLRRAAKMLDSLDQQALTVENSAAASIAVAEAKVLTTDIALRASEKLLEWGGSRATLLQHGLDRHWRNARTHTLHDPVRWKTYAIGNYYLNAIYPARHAWI